MKTIAIDIDGTLTGNDLECAIYSAKLGRPILPHDLIDYNVAKALSITEDEERAIWDKKTIDLFYDNADPDIAAIKKVNQISEEYDAVIILSKRFSYGYDATLRWLKRNKVYFNKLVLTNEQDKTPFLDLYKVNTIVEDNDYYIDYLSGKANLYTYLVERPYNKNKTTMANEIIKLT